MKLLTLLTRMEFHTALCVFGLIVSVLVAFAINFYRKAAREALQAQAARSALADATGEHEKTRHELAQTLSRLELATNAGGIGVWSWEINSGRIVWNELMYALYDIAPDTTPTYEIWRGAVHPDDLAMAESHLDIALQGKDFFDTEFRVLHTSGDVRYLGAIANVEHDSAGHPRSVTGINWDMTDHKLVEKRLYKSLQQNEFLANIVKLSSQPFAVGFPDGRIGQFNSAFERLTGYSGDELNSIYWATTLTPPEWREAEGQQLIELNRTGQPVQYEKEYIRKNLSRVPVELLVHFVPGSERSPDYYYAFVTDISERKRSAEALHEHAVMLEQEIAERQQAQEQLAVKQTQLETLNHNLQQRVDETVNKLRQQDQMLIVQGRQAAMGEMIGNIAHQWRQPLNALSVLVSNLQFAQQDNELTPEYVNESVNIANRLINKMSSTITDFRNFFSPDKEKRAFSVMEQIRNSIGLVETAFKNNRITVEINAGADCQLYGYANEYSQVLLNLLSNAREAIRDSESAPGRIVISLAMRNGRGIVTVRDNGGGIPADVRDRIFEPYFSTKKMGTGIGLYMSKMIIERNMGGVISARNIGDGAEFVISLPLAEVLT